MAKFQSPLLGYNNNVRHKGRVFHIQTEDSGVNHPHIITHLFMDGGRILKSVKKSYAEHVGIDGMSEIVRGLMKEQHKAMFIALRDGQFDHLVEGAAPGPAGAPAVKAAAPPAPPPPSPPIVPKDTPMAIMVPAPPSNPELPVDSAPKTIETPRRASGEFAPPPASITEPKGTVIERPISSATNPKPLVLAEDDDDDEPKTTRQPEPPPISHEPPPPSRRERAVPSERYAPPPPPSAQELTLDFDALERANEAGPVAASSLFQSNDLPPPPKNLFNKEPGTGGTYRTIEAPEERAPASTRSPASRPHPTHPGGRTPPQPSTRPSQNAQRVAAAAAARHPSESRYAPARPAAIFGAAAKQTSQSIFSDELVSDKSLDEVILSYLAEDLEPPRRK
jgi:hypothetical protein